MLAIEFMHGQDCSRLYERATKGLAKLTTFPSLSLQMQEHDGVIHCDYAGTEMEWEHAIRPYMAAVITDDIIQCYEETMMEKLIKERYAFRDPDEREQIMTLARGLLTGERTEIPEIRKSGERKTVLYETIHDHLIEHSIFHWNPFLTFCLGKYEGYLEELVEVCIEEYEMEQEYQTIVDTLRSYVQSATPVVEELHFYYENSDRFTLYDQKGVRWDAEKRIHYIQSRLVFEEGLSPVEMIISPIASLAPANLYIYTDRDDGVVQTLRTIFQERIWMRTRADWFEE